jgi:hypothetical protein
MEANKKVFTCLYDTKSGKKDKAELKISECTVQSTTCIVVSINSNSVFLPKVKALELIDVLINRISEIPDDEE